MGAEFIAGVIVGYYLWAGVCVMAVVLLLGKDVLFEELRRSPEKESR